MLGERGMQQKQKQLLLHLCVGAGGAQGQVDRKTPGD